MSKTTENADFVRRLVDLANRNEATMDATIEPVRRIVENGDVVFAVWQDPDEPHGVGFLAIKGAKRLKETVATQTARVAQVSAVKCTCIEQAIALQQLLGERIYDA